MDIMLASFGLGEKVYWESRAEKPPLEDNIFFRYAPPFLPSARSFVVDVSPFILYDKVIVNKSWIDGKEEWQQYRTINPLLRRENISELSRLGIIEIRDYVSDSISHLDLLELITKHNLSNLDLWREVLKFSLGSWLDYMFKMLQIMPRLLDHQILNDNPLIRRVRNLQAHSSRYYSFFSKEEINENIENLPIDDFRRLAQSYLLNVNNSLLLSREYFAGIFDWFDYEPFYRTKLMIGKVGQPSAISTVSLGGTILSYYLPIERIDSIQELVRARDKARGLREYIESKQWEQSANERTLLKILLDIQQAQKKTEYYQKISSYFTVFLTIIPIFGSVIERYVRGAVDWQIEKRYLGDYKWHFSLLDYTSIDFDKSALFNQRQEVLPPEIFPDVFDNFEECQAKTKVGRKCRNKAKLGSRYCWVHETQNK